MAAIETFSNSDRRLLWLLTPAVLAFQVYQALTQPLGYDEGWHIFFAELEPLSRALAEMRRDSHPPLTYLLLRPLVAIGYDPVWPRLLSVLPAVVQPALILFILLRLGVARPLAWATTLVFAGSHAFTEISVVVRAYSFATACSLGALAAAMKIATGAGTRTAAVAAASLPAVAVLSLYPAGFFTTAILGATLVACARRPFARQLFDRWRRVGKRRDLAVFAIGHVAAFAYFLLTYGDKVLPHVGEWFLGERSPVEFAFDGTARNLSYFTPIDVAGSDLTWLVVLAVAAIGATAAALASRRRSEPDGLPRTVLFAALIAIHALLFGLALFDLHPFGGELRHQYVLFPLVVLCAAFAGDELVRAVRSPAAPVALAIAVVGAGVFTSLQSFRSNAIGEFPDHSTWTEEGQRLLEAATAGTPIYAPVYGMVGLYGTHRARGWRWRENLDDGIDVFDVDRGITLYRDRHAWSQPQLPTDELVSRIERVLTDASSDSVWMFTPRTEDFVPVDAETLVQAWSSRGFAVSCLERFAEGERYRLSRG